MKKLTTRLRRRDDIGILGIFVCVFVALALFGPAGSTSLEAMFGRASINGLVALGLTMVIVQGGLDLSVGSTLALAAIVTVKVSDGVAVAIVAAVAVGLGVGLINGFVVTVMRVNSFIATLGTMVAVRGLAYLITHSTPVSGGSIEASLTLTRPLVWFLTPQILIFLGAAVVCYAFLSLSSIGREFYAVGGNPEAARACGTPVRRRQVQGFAISGMLAGLAGWVLATQLNSGSPTMGTETALLAIAAVVIGGTSLLGGRGTAFGTVLGVCTVALISDALDAAGASAGYESIAAGGILLVVVALDQLSMPAWIVGRWTRLRDRARSTVDEKTGPRPMAGNGR
jgi:ribose transport system permease protein